MVKVMVTPAAAGGDIFDRLRDELLLVVLGPHDHYRNGLDLEQITSILGQFEFVVDEKRPFDLPSIERHWED